MDNYYSVVSKILNLASKQNFVQEVHYGDAIDWLGSGDHKYCSFCVVEQPNNQFGDQFNIFNFVLYIVDRLEEDNSNLLEVHSNTKTIGEHLLRTMPDDWTIVNQSFTPFKYKFADLCAGNFVTISLQVPVEFVCEDDAWEPIILKIDKNGEYNLNGYDTAIVDVHSTDVFNYFTLYPSNYIYANYLDLSTEIVANVKFTGDEDFYFCSDEKGLIGLYFDAKENETYAWWDSDRIALHFHKRDWDKGFYKIQFKAGRLQIGYLTWTLDSNSSTTSFDPLYFGYYKDKTSPMEIEYITISNQYGAAYDYRPKITDEYAELVEVISGKIADIRTVYTQNEYEANVLNYLNNGGTFTYYSGQSIPKIDWSKLDKPNYDYFMNTCYCTWDDIQNFWNIYDDSKSFKDAQQHISISEHKTDVFLTLPKGFKNTKNQNCILASLAKNNGLKTLTIDCNDLEYTGTLLGWSGTFRLKLLNTSKLKEFSNPTSNIELDAFDCSSLIKTPYNGYHNQTSYIGGFIDLGKGFLQNGKAANHLMYFDPWMQNLTKESLLNIFNGLYDLNLLGFTFVNQPTIKLGATNFARVTEEDIKIATDKGWIVTQ